MKYVVLIDIWRKNEKKIIVRHLNVAIFIFSRENSEFNGKFHLVILQLASLLQPHKKLSFGRYKFCTISQPGLRYSIILMTYNCAYGALFLLLYGL